MRLVKPNRITHSSHPHAALLLPGPRLPRRFLHALQQFPAYALPAPLRDHFQRLNVSNQSRPLPRPFDNRKPAHPSIVFRNPRRRVMLADKLPHVCTAEPKRRLKTHLFDGIQRTKICSLKQTVKHSPTLPHHSSHQQKATPASRMAFCSFAKPCRCSRPSLPGPRSRRRSADPVAGLWQWLP